MNRPFCIVYSINNRRGKYHFFDHRSNELVVYKSVPEHFFKKLLSHPITAFGYRFVDITPDIIPRFSKHDVIRALDLEILGNERVRIGGDIFVVLEPIQINMN